ncbi:hypothetical protein LCGC14_1125890 [marine sediment metagenome]|uniref:PBSX family phage terminase large subunit n=2 Tax=root TaxID=1 RepID=A0A831VMD6_9FLAO|nr:PBSX family phage terminase large subunit [Pricia antarctica]
MDPTNVNISRKVFNPKFLPLLDNDDAVNIFYGGASSGKSHFLAQRVIYRMLKDIDRNTMVVRKVARTNRGSTFAEIKKVINTWEMNSLFKINKSEMTITRKGGGQIRFEGLDDVQKLKSVTFERGVLNDIWFEEATEGSQDDVIELELRLRGLSKVPFQLTMSFNPISALHWIKKVYFDAQHDNVTIHHSTYLDNRFLGEREKKTLQNLKASHLVKYDIYALGKWGVLGGLIYTNYKVHKFEDDFDRHYNGLDWGYKNPAAFLKMGFRDQEIYIIDEFYMSGVDNPGLMRAGKRVWDKQRDRITADSAEPRSIKEWQTAGWMIEGARKGKDSVRNGIGWIRSHPMHIHPRCQNFINEIQGYVYRKDKDGNETEEPLDFRNHLMDAKRYGFEELMDLKEFRVLAV